MARSHYIRTRSEVVVKINRKLQKCSRPTWHWQNGDEAERKPHTLIAAYSTRNAYHAVQTQAESAGCPE